jgi:hypothetical protein
MTPNELAARRAAKRKLGWDECGATGQSHDPEDKPQKDGLYHCRYCGAEALPEETVDGRQLAQEAFDAVERYFDWASENEAMWTGWGDQVVPAAAEWRRVKAKQALDAISDCVEPRRPSRTAIDDALTPGMLPGETHL